MQTQQKNNRAGFTLVELLVVVAIIVVLIALLTPALDKAMEATERATCGARLHVQDLGLKLYAFEGTPRGAYPPPVRNGHWPDGGMVSSDGLLGMDKSVSAGQVYAWEKGFLVNPEAFYCPSKKGQFNFSKEKNWFADQVNNGDRFYATYVGYPYWGKMRSTSDATDNAGDLTLAVADSIRSEGTRVLLSDEITIDSGSDFPDDMSQNHRSDGLAAKDADGLEHLFAPVGGNVLFNDGAAVWRNFNEVRLRLEHPKAASYQRDFYF